MYVVLNTRLELVRTPHHNQTITPHLRAEGLSQDGAADVGDELARGDVEESDGARADAADDQVVVLWQEAAEEDEEAAALRVRLPQQRPRPEVPEGDDAVRGAAHQELVRFGDVEVEHDVLVAFQSGELTAAAVAELAHGDPDFAGQMVSELYK